MGRTSQAGSRISRLLDENSFVEIGALVKARNTDFNVGSQAECSDGVITGYGLIGGNPVYVFSQDASVMGGSVGEMHAKKIENIYNMAIKCGAPVIGFYDSVGFRLAEGSDALEGFGRIYKKMAQASGIIPQINAVFGTCGGGLAIAAGMADFTFMEKEKARLFVNSPNALAGNYEEKCNTAASAFQMQEAGTVDYAGTEEEILTRIRELVSILPANNQEDYSMEECGDDINRLCQGIETVSDDALLALKAISDGGVVIETKEKYCDDMVCAFIRLDGATVGAIANRSLISGDEKKKPGTLISARGARKAAKMVKFCDAFNIPLLTLTNVTGFQATKHNERALADAMAAMAAAFAQATVPKVNVVLKNAYGSPYVAMNSKALGADMVIAWEGAKIGTMDAGLAAKIMCDGEDASVVSENASRYSELQNNVCEAAARGYVDTIINPADTRRYLISAFEMINTKMEFAPPKKHSTL